MALEHYVGATMRLVWQWVWARTFEGVVRAGFDDVNPAHVGLFRYPTLAGRRLIDIAQQMQITKQSAHELVGHLEARGYLVRELDPNDRRARVVRLTAKGKKLEGVIRSQARQAEEEIAALLGPRRFAQLDEVARHVANHDRPTAAG